MATRGADVRLTTQTALALIVPKHLQADVSALRSIHDKAYSKWEPHINIIYPFVETSSLSSAIPILKTLLRDHPNPRLQVRLDSVGVFKHRRNATVFLKPDEETSERICELRGEMMRALGCEEKEGMRDGTFAFSPHLTIGQAGFLGMGIERLSDKVEKLCGLEWEWRSLVVLKRELSGEMKVIEELRLGDGEDEVEDECSVRTTWKPSYFFEEEHGWTLSRTNGKNENKTSKQISISTYNIMAELFAPPFVSRLPLIVDALNSTKIPSNSSPKILCLQEVNDESLPLLLEHPYIQEAYPYSTHAKSSLLPSHRNLVTFASEPFNYFTLQFEERHKSALIVSFRDFPLAVANIHLSSSLKNETVMTKKSQMDSLTQFIREDPILKGKGVVVTGDFNLTSSLRTIETALSSGIITPETAQLVSKVVDEEIWDDAYLSVQANQEHRDDGFEDGEGGATFDRLSNPLAATLESIIDKLPQRYDRVICQKDGNLRAESLERFGLPNSEGRCGSDHYGVCAVLCMKSFVQSKPLPETKSEAKIKIIPDSTNILPILQPYLPSDADEKQREVAILVLQSTLSNNRSLSKAIIAPLGSYSMETYDSNSDVDVLVIGSVAPSVFFDAAVTQLQGLDDAFKGIHFVNSLVSIIEVSVMGIKFDLQYCQAPELLERYHRTKTPPDLAQLVFEGKLISSLSPSSLRPLNTYRDTAYLLNTLPALPSYRLAHRYLSRYLKNHGLYSAKFGYLGGIHLSLMLNHVMKLSAVTSDQDFAPAAIIRTFFFYFAAFDWARDIIIDPSRTGSSPSRSPREAIFILAIHTPTARPNVASSCTKLSAQALTREFSLASELLSQGEWEKCLSSRDEGVKRFLEGWGAFVRVNLDVWDIGEIEGSMDKVREMVGGLESKLTRLMVSLGRVEGLLGQVWPSRFRTPRNGEEGEEEGWEAQLKGYYLVGITARDKLEPQDRKLFTGKILTAVREFEANVKESKEFEGGNVWIFMEVVPKKKILEMGLVVDERVWGEDQGGKPGQPTLGNIEPLVQATSNLTVNVNRQRSHSTSLRPAQDIISRIRWDPDLFETEFVVGYEDRFVGVKETELTKWKSEQTDEEFIPKHRIVWLRKKGEDGGQIVWDRRKKIDLLFGSGVGGGSCPR